MSTKMDKLLQKSGKDLVNHVFSDDWDEFQPNLSEILVQADLALYKCSPKDTAAISHYRSIIEEIERAIFSLNLDQD